MVRFIICVFWGILAVGGSSLWARTDTKVESSRPVTSEDGKRTVVVDRLTPVVDGEPERFSGRMLIRVTSTDGTAARQRYIEASQVRVVQPPVWLDGSRVCAFVYNVAKNSNGIVYFEPDTNKAIQVEFVMPSRRMASSGKVEQELTSLEVTEFAKDTMKVRNVPWKGGSAFPLVLDPLPEFQGRPYDIKFLQALEASISAYNEWLAKNNIKHLEPEQASESFSQNDAGLALLACGVDNSYLLSIPLKAGGPTAVLPSVRAVKIAGLDLSCAQHAATESEEAPVSDNRFLTNWKDDSTIQVVKESYDAETDAARVMPVAQMDVRSGTVTDMATTGTQPAAK